MSRLRKKKASIKRCKDKLFGRLKVLFGGKFGEYKFYDKGAVIGSALVRAEKELQ